MGETENPLHLRMNGDWSDYYRKLPNKPVAVHFNPVRHTFENLTVMIIEQPGSAPTERRKGWESYWIHTLQSMAPHRLNLEEQIHITRSFGRNHAIGGRGLTRRSYNTI